LIEVYRYLLKKEKQLMEFRSINTPLDRRSDQTQKKEKRRIPHFFPSNSSQVKETSSVFPNARDNGKGLAPPDEKEHRVKASGEDGKPIPKTVNLSTESTLDNPRMLGGGQNSRGESSRGSDVSKDWLKSYDGKNWLKSDDGKDWLKSNDGKDWLKSYDGKGWLKSYDNDGKDWLKSDDGKDWLKSDDGRDWLKSYDGKDWLDSDRGRNWLKSDDGKSWFKSNDGNEWFDSYEGWKWLKSDDGIEWLDSDDGINWLEDYASNRWLDSYESSNWRNSRTTDNCRWLNYTRGRVYLI
jgi:hypothetical protein